MILVFYQLIIKQQTAVPLLQIEPAEVVRTSDEDEAPQYTQNMLEGLYALRISQEELESTAGDRDVQSSLLSLPPP